MKIPFAKPLITEKERFFISKVIKSPILTHGENLSNFENDFRKKFNFKYAHGVSSCTAALHLSFMAINLKKGDEVIVPNQTHVSTVHTFQILGAKPVFIDSNNSDGNIDTNKIEKKITRKTKAIVAVHYLGKPADIIKIKNICNKKKLYLIEDCALSIGAKVNNKYVGGFGHFGCFSFYPAKHITTADGGMLVCQNKKLYEKIKLLKGFGVNKNFNERKIPGEYDVKLLGLNYRLDEIRSRLGITQLKKLDNFISLRKKNYLFLKNSLKEMKQFKFLNLESENNIKSSYFCASIILSNKLKKNRYKIIKNLKDIGIGTSIHYPKIVSDYTYYKNKYKISTKNFPNAAILSYRSINLPVGPHLTRKDLLYIISKIKEIFKKFT